MPNWSKRLIIPEQAEGEHGTNTMFEPPGIREDALGLKCS